MAPTLELFPDFGFERLLNRIKLKADCSGRALVRGLIFALVAWGPMAIWSFISGNAQHPEHRLRFLYDFAAYAQFWIGMPLLSLAQWLIGRGIARSVSFIASSGLLPAESIESFGRQISHSQRLIRSKWIEPIILLASFITPWAWLSQEIQNGISTWHAPVVNGVERLSMAGVWEGLFAIPLFWFLIYRWLWRIFVWFLTLFKISKLKLNLSASHPDRMGGLRFISNIQANFGVLIFVFGCVIASSTLYKIMIEKAEFTSLSVWGMVVPFMILGPAAFLAPLLVFTPVLLRLRTKSQLQYSQLASRYTQEFENKWIKSTDPESDVLVGSSDIQSLADLGSTFDRITSLKIIPFDFRNMIRLFASAFSPMIPVIFKILPISGWVKKISDIFIS